MSTKKENLHVIWSNIDLNLEDWKEDLAEDYPDADDYELYQIMVDMNNDYLQDERFNLDIWMPHAILVIADLGLWNGRRSGYKEIRSGNIADCLESGCDYAEWYVDELGDFRCKAIHHDGTNYYLYRVWKDGVTDSQRDSLKDKIYRGEATRADITRLTKRLGDDIAEVYGWKVYRAKKGA